MGEAQWKEIASALKAVSGDAMVLVWAPKEDAETAAREVLIRAREALVGIPAETRQAHRDGTNGFERILPGPDRMYPDTDTPPLPIPDSMVAEVRAQLGETPWARQERYQGMGLGPRAAQVLSVAPWATTFDELSPEPGMVARRLAGALEKRIPHHRRRTLGSKPRSPEDLPDVGGLGILVQALEGGEIRPEALEAGLDDLLVDPRVAPEEVLARYRVRPEDEEALPAVLDAAAARARRMGGRSREARIRWALGRVLREFFGRLDPNEIRERLSAALSDSGSQESEEAES